VTADAFHARRVERERQLRRAAKREERQRRRDVRRSIEEQVKAGLRPPEPHAEPSPPVERPSIDEEVEAYVRRRWSGLDAELAGQRPPMPTPRPREDPR
jgi:hypothetical protein